MGRGVGLGLVAWWPWVQEHGLEDVLAQQREAESSRKAADALSEELRRKLEDAERRAAEAAQQQKANLDAAREEEVKKRLGPLERPR